MTSQRCPYLGLSADSKTALDFPSDGNCCHHARPVIPVSRAHQKAVCLTLEFSACPVYQRTGLAPLPRELIAPVFVRTLVLRAIYGSIFLILLIAVGVTVARLASSLGFADARVTGTGQNTDTSGPGSSEPILVAEPGNTAVFPSTHQAATITAESEAVRAGCVAPNGWIPYTVKPTDSIFRLSLVYGISVADLQVANCLGESTYVRPGEIIYVPNPPTSTPTYTPVPPTATFMKLILSPTPSPTKEDEPEPKPTLVPTRPPNASPTSRPDPTNTPRPPDTPTARPPASPTNTSPPILTPTSPPPP